MLPGVTSGVAEPAPSGDLILRAVSGPLGGAPLTPPATSRVFARPSSPPVRPADPDADRGGVDWLLYRLWEHCDATEAQLEMVKRFCELYSRYGLIDELGDPLPLFRACRHCDSCWAPVPQSEVPRPENAEVSVPWIGSSYFIDRICALAINSNRYGALGGHWWITRGHIRDLRAGIKPRGGFAYGTGSILAAIEASLHGQPLPEEPPNLDLIADAWHSTAFQESVKCAPEVGRGTPTGAMWQNCPSTYLLEELRLLQPRVLLLVGRTDVAPRVLDLIDATEIDRGDHFQRHGADLFGSPADVFSVNHPSWGHWKQSYPELLASLKRSPALAG